MSNAHDDTREDFVLLELRGGYPVLRVNQGSYEARLAVEGRDPVMRVNQGSGEARLAVDGRDSQGRLRVGKLSDGLWHRLDIFINGQVDCIARGLHYACR